MSSLAEMMQDLQERGEWVDTTIHNVQELEDRIELKKLLAVMSNHYKLCRDKNKRPVSLDIIDEIDKVYNKIAYIYHNMPVQLYSESEESLLKEFSSLQEYKNFLQRIFSENQEGVSISRLRFQDSVNECIGKARFILTSSCMFTDFFSDNGKIEDWYCVRNVTVKNGVINIYLSSLSFFVECGIFGREILVRRREFPMVGGTLSQQYYLADYFGIDKSNIEIIDSKELREREKLQGDWQGDWPSENSGRGGINASIFDR